MTETTHAEIQCIKAQHRRDARRAVNVCINGPFPTTHGPVVRGGKCQACIETHRRCR